VKKLNDRVRKVDKSHYQFRNYVNKHRLLSIWHQLDEVFLLNPSSILELGIGPGLFKLILSHFGYVVTTVDIDPELKPDYVASATEIPIADNSYDCVCSFQMLEHLPYEQSLIAFSEMVRIARNNIIISLPDAKSLWVYSLHIPKLGQVTFHVPRPRLRQKKLKVYGLHYWEINKPGYPLEKIISDFNKYNVCMIKTYRVIENPYHRFFLFKILK